MRVKAHLLLLCVLILPAIGVAAEKAIYGLNEHVGIPDFNLEVEAKLDTGAQTASLSARDITRFKRKGESWVRFYLAVDSAHAHPIERPWRGSARSNVAPATSIRKRKRPIPHGRSSSSICAWAGSNAPSK